LSFLTKLSTVPKQFPISYELSHKTTIKDFAVFSRVHQTNPCSVFKSPLCSNINSTTGNRNNL